MILWAFQLFTFLSVIDGVPQNFGQYRQDQVTLSNIEIDIKDSNFCGGYVLFAKICINSVCCEEKLTEEEPGFSKGDKIQYFFEKCQTSWVSVNNFDPIGNSWGSVNDFNPKGNATIQFFSYEKNDRLNPEGFCPSKAKLTLKIGSEYSGLFANFDGENIYQTPITDLTCGCSIYGSKILSCDVETRNCYCQSGFSGSRCDQECQFGEDCDDYGPRTSLLRGGNSQQYSKVAVFGGQGGYGHKTEVIDLSRPTHKCDSLNDAEPRWAAVGGWLNGQPVVCGGKIVDNEASNDCFPNIPFNMLERRQFAASVVLNFLAHSSDDVLWITGGNNGRGSDLDSSEFVASNKPAQRGPNLPFTVNSHCMVKYSPTQIFLIGGYQNDGNGPETSRKTWIFDSTKNFRVTRGPDLKEGRFWHSCGKFNYNGKDVIAVVGGANENGYMNSVELLDPSSFSNSWFFGANLPFPLGNSALVTSADGKGMVMIGGKSGTEALDVLLEYQYGYSGDTWTRVQRKLEYPRENHVAFNILQNDKTYCYEY